MNYTNVLPESLLTLLAKRVIMGGMLLTLRELSTWFLCLLMSPIDLGTVCLYETYGACWVDMAQTV